MTGGALSLASLGPDAVKCVALLERLGAGRSLGLDAVPEGWTVRAASGRWHYTHRTAEGAMWRLKKRLQREVARMEKQSA